VDPVAAWPGVDPAIVWCGGSRGRGTKMKSSSRIRDSFSAVLRTAGGLVKRTMGLEEQGAMRGNVHLVLRGADGRVKHDSVHNTVTTAGKNGTADQILASPTLGKPTHMAIGTGSPAATLLGAELDRNALTTKTRSGAVVTMVGDWAAGDGTGTITEAGIFDVVTPNTVNMWCSASFGAITKAAGDTLQITWTLTVS